MNMNEVAGRRPATVFVVDGDTTLRDGVLRLLGSVELDALGFAAPGDLLARPPDPPPACVIAEMRIPEMNGLDLHEALSTRGLRAPFILLTGLADVRLTVRAMKAGVADVIEKPFDPQALIDSVQRALRSRCAQADRFSPASELARRASRLTPRERDVLALVARGDTNKLIARHLGLSARTVEVYRARMIEKMGAESTTELVRLVTEYGLAAHAGGEAASAVRPAERLYLRGGLKCR